LYVLGLENKLEKGEKYEYELGCKNVEEGKVLKDGCEVGRERDGYNYPNELLIVNMQWHSIQFANRENSAS